MATMKKTTLALILTVKALLAIWLILNAGIGLGPDEAQYWTWSQQIDWGYYSKPPGIAWQIWTGTTALGTTELGVRIGSVILSAAVSLAVYLLARVCLLQRSTAFWAAVAMALTPLGIMSSFLAITDVGMVLFWTLACATFASALQRGTPPNGILLGLLVMCGAFFKWPIYLFWLLVLLYPKKLTRQVFLGMALSLLGLLPSIIWNAQHDWPTFLHVLYTITGSHGKEVGTTPLPKGNFWDFVGAQAALLSPILFILLLCAWSVLIRSRRSIPEAVRFCGTVSLILLGSYSAVAIVKKMQGNWCVFAYPTAIVFLSWYACEHVRGKKWLIAGVTLSAVLATLPFAIPFLQAQSIVNIPYKINPFRHNVGWDRLHDELKNVGYDPEKHFLFGDKYQVSSILSFYGPGQKRAYFLNLQGSRKNQFSYWPSMADEQIGKTGFFVLTENRMDLDDKIEAYQKDLEEYFSEVRLLGVRPLFYSYGRPVKEALLFRCVNYNGKEPPDPNLY